jgi:hypothetical protein
MRQVTYEPILKKIPGKPTLLFVIDGIYKAF